MADANLVHAELPGALQREWVGVAESLARIAIDTVRAHDDWSQIELKHDGSPVTEIDRRVEQALREEINQRLPEHGILGEEFGAENTDRDWVWIIDPIDGTRQFSAGLPNFGCLIALCHQQQPLLGVVVQPWAQSVCIGLHGSQTRVDATVARTSTETELGKSIVCLSDPDAFVAGSRAGYEALRAASMWNVYDGGCQACVAIARGRLGVSLYGPNLEEFDIAPLIPVITGAGGCITDWQGQPLNRHSTGAIVASANATLHAQVLALLAAA